MRWFNLLWLSKSTLATFKRTSTTFLNLPLLDRSRELHAWLEEIDVAGNLDWKIVLVGQVSMDTLQNFEASIKQTYFITSNSDLSRVGHMLIIFRTEEQLGMFSGHINSKPAFILVVLDVAFVK